jgi:hypothetical protein
MKKGYTLAKTIYRTAPLLAYTLPAHLQRPYKNKVSRHIGLEVEVIPKDPKIWVKFLTLLNAYTGMPNLYQETNEVKILLPTGENFYTALYLFSLGLQELCYANPDSGIHYHVQLCAEACGPESISLALKERTLESFATWNYTGSYNNREFSTDFKFGWLNRRTGLQTLEIRIGAMTTQYSELLDKCLNSLYHTLNFEAEHLKSIGATTRTFEQPYSNTRTKVKFTRKNKTKLPEILEFLKHFREWTKIKNLAV